MSPFATLLLSVLATASVSGLGFYTGYKNNNNQGGSGHGGSGQGGGGQVGDWSNKWSSMNTKQQSCFEPTPVNASLMHWFFTLANGLDLSVELANYRYKLTFAEVFLSGPVHSMRELSSMNLTMRYDLQFANYYLVTYTGFGNIEVVINCTLAVVDDVHQSSVGCVPVPDANSPGTNVTLLDPSFGWAVYQNETLGIVVTINCFGGMETGTASWGLYAVYDDEIDPSALSDIYDIVTVQYGLSWI